jgi:FMN-dependent NADH-azoreductase
VREALPGGWASETDLALDPPPLLDARTVPLYERRSYLGQSLSAAELAALAPFDRYVEQIEAADRVVLAFPMYNFSLPAAVKAWLDAVMQKGRTWTADASGYRGLMQGREALVLVSAGGWYQGERAAWDHATPLLRQAFSFMGFDACATVLVEGVNADPAGAPARLAAGRASITRVVEDWRSATACRA